MTKTSLKAKSALVAASVAALSFCNSSKGSIVISQIYGEGGYSSTGTYLNDYIELYNADTIAVNIGGYSLEYGGYTGAVGAATYDIATLPSYTLPSGAYYLVDLPAASTLTTHQYGTPLSSAFTQSGILVDTTYANSFVPSYLGGKLGLFDASGNLQDYVGYGDDTAVGTDPAGASGTSFTLPFPQTANAGTGSPASFTVGTAGATDFTGTNALIRDGYSGNNLADFIDGTAAPATPANVSVPEPASIGLLAAGGALLVARRRQRRTGDAK